MMYTFILEWILGTGGHGFRDQSKVQCTFYHFETEKSLEGLKTVLQHPKSQL